MKKTLLHGYYVPIFDTFDTVLFWEMNFRDVMMDDKKILVVKKVIF